MLCSPKNGRRLYSLRHISIMCLANDVACLNLNAMEQRPSWEARLDKKFLAFHGTRWFIWVFKRASHLSLSLSWWVQSSAFAPPSLSPILMYSFHLLLDCTNGLLPTGSPTITLYAFLFYSTYRSFPTTVSQLKMCYFSGEIFKSFEVL